MASDPTRRPLPAQATQPVEKEQAEDLCTVEKADSDGVIANVVWYDRLLSSEEIAQCVTCEE